MQTFLCINIWAQLVTLSLSLSPNTCVKVISSRISKGNSSQKIIHPACFAPFPQTHLVFSIPLWRGSVSFSGLLRSSIVCGLLAPSRQAIAVWILWVLLGILFCLFFFCLLRHLSEKVDSPLGPLWKNNHTVWTLHLTATSTGPPISIVVHSVKADKKLLWDVNPSA